MRLILVGLLFSTALMLTGPIAGQPPLTQHDHAVLLKRVIERNHYSPTAIDDSFSVKLFNGIIRRINNDYEYLAPPDVKALEADKFTLDDELNGNNWLFLTHLTKLFKERLTSVNNTLKNNKADQKQQREISRLLSNENAANDYLFATYLEVLANIFDPHTEYMSAQEKQSFESSLDTEGYFFGFSFEEDDNGAVQISRIVPGSPAWRCGELNSGDVIVSAGWEGQEQMKADEGLAVFSELLAKKITDKLKLTVKKADGTLKTASLEREKINNEENTVRSFVLKGEENIGYIHLPDFYTGFGGSNASSANDVAKEIIKLKKENINGLILDLRYNGGGSLQEAVDMAGIFIDAGPVCMIRDKGGKVFSLKDVNRGTIYDGPLLLLINGQSASASELLAGVLQDYNRAIVVGSATFGKGTVQSIFPLDTTNTLNISPGAGFVKVTTSKFYRISGNTTQNKGVVPDIPLPDIFDALNYKESALPFALSADNIPKNKYYEPLATLQTPALASKSKLRVSQSQKFAAVQKFIEALKAGKEPKVTDTLNSPLSNIYTVTNNTFDTGLVTASTYNAELNSAWIEKIKGDFYVQEAYQILHDHKILNQQ